MNKNILTIVIDLGMEDKIRKNILSILTDNKFKCVEEKSLGTRDLFITDNITNISTLEGTNLLICYENETSLKVEKNNIILI